MDFASEAANTAIANLRRRLDQGALDALRSGKDWAEGPIVDSDPMRWMKPIDIFQPMHIDVEVKCGPVEPGCFVPPEGWRLIRHEDWVAAGRPGDLVTMTDLEKPRCGCPPEVARRVIVDHGVCGKGGCPYGGDF